MDEWNLKMFERNFICDDRSILFLICGPCKWKTFNPGVPIRFKPFQSWLKTCLKIFSAAQPGCKSFSKYRNWLYPCSQPTIASLVI